VGGEPLKLLLSVDVFSQNELLFSLNFPFSLTDMLDVMLSEQTNDLGLRSGSLFHFFDKIFLQVFKVKTGSSEHPRDIWRLAFLVIHEEFVEDAHCL